MLADPYPAEMPSKPRSGQQRTQSHRSHCGSVGEGENAYPPQQAVADDKVDHPPDHVDHRRGFSHARRLGERTLEGAAGNAVDEVGNAVDQKDTGKEINQSCSPLHSYILPNVCYRFCVLQPRRMP